MPGIKELKNRIKSIASTRKITRAMQMVSAAKMRKAQNAVLQSRLYADLAWDLIHNISRRGSFNHPLIKVYPKAEKSLVLLISSNSGLVGSLNTNLIAAIKKELLDQITFQNQNKKVEFVTYGKKGAQIMGRLGMFILADFIKNERHFNSEEIYPLAQLTAEKYSSGDYKNVYIAYNQFISTLSQKPALKMLLPFSKDLVSNLADSGDMPIAGDTEYIFEPGINEVLNHLLPRIIESQIYEAVLESNASEHSARMVMMKNATESAGDLIADYTLTYNQLRQGKITTELAEITAGKIALE